MCDHYCFILLILFVNINLPRYTDLTELRALAQEVSSSKVRQGSSSSDATTNLLNECIHDLHIHNNQLIGTYYTPQYHHYYCYYIYALSPPLLLPVAELKASQIRKEELEIRLKYKSAACDKQKERTQQLLTELETLKRDSQSRYKRLAAQMAGSGFW